MTNPLTKPDDPASKLTIREHMATELLSGIMASKEPYGNFAPNTDDAKFAVKVADALIEALNEPH